MENLPLPILVEILSRLGDSTDLARCRLASRTLRFLSCDVRSISVVCSRERFLRSRAPATRDFIIPFRTLVLNLLSFLSGSEGALRSLSISAEVPDAAGADEEEDDVGFDDADDLHLTSADFLSQCLPSVALGLTSLSIGDYWCQACWRPSTALQVISEQCCNLLNLEMKNASLSVDGLKPMPKLTNLRLEFIRLDDEDLDKVNESFPSLKILKLIGVGGLRKPTISLPHLRICHWTVSNFPLCLAVHAPNLVELKLECVEPKYLVLEAPLLSQINLKIKKPGGLIKVHSFPYLNSIKLKTSDLKGIKRLFEGCKAVTKLELEGFQSSNANESFGKFTALDIVSTFPNVDELKLGPGAWTQLENYVSSSISSQWRKLKRLSIKLPPVDLDIELVSSVLNFCMPSCEVAVLIHKDSSDSIKNRTIGRCRSHFPIFKWKWGIWKESCVDNFMDLHYEINF
ncbi:F-box/LRR-repeat protein At4g29420 [Phalaenopsis equestris]|uniref:F-box/LRR-repeat protein At4g29420 n=1 Tax=Phalaenopsis equestris TaxID=78828 RepID=UPI0009E1D6C2|nr:F-box/LRR-repeat protein At4g29420 [Phalaenopsis equestris]